MSTASAPGRASASFTTSEGEPHHFIAARLPSCEVAAADEAERPRDAAQLAIEGDQQQDRSGFPPLAPRGSLARLERSLAALPERLRLACGVVAGEGDVGDVREGYAHAASGGFVVQVE